MTSNFANPDFFAKREGESQTAFEMRNPAVPLPP